MSSVLFVVDDLAVDVEQHLMEYFSQVDKPLLWGTLTKDGNRTKIHPRRVVDHMNADLIGTKMVNVGTTNYAH